MRFPWLAAALFLVPHDAFASCRIEGPLCQTYTRYEAIFDGTVAAIDRVDLPTTMGVVIFGTLCILAFNLVVDVLYAWIDPRIRLT